MNTGLSATKRKRRPPNYCRAIVHLERAKCPHCKSGDLKIRRTRRDPDGDVSRDALCKTCGETFLILEH